MDKVRGYTNLFVIGLPEVSLNETLLNLSCDYIFTAGLNFIVLYTDLVTYSYAPIDWTTAAKQKYGDHFLGVYRFDEPGGQQLELGRTNSTDLFLDSAAFPPERLNYTGAAQDYTAFLQRQLGFYHELLYPTLFTSDFGLYWFDYQAGYDVVFTEFVWNQSRQLAISLCRGAATAMDKDWGAIVTWKYDQPPYIESGSELYNDLLLAYNQGAKFLVVFDYPNLTSYGVLGEEHFEALQTFWNYIQNNPQQPQQNRVAYVLPQGYGFGFRGPNDTVWGLWNDPLTSQIWTDVNTLLNQYGSRFDIVYNDPETLTNITCIYSQLFYWNQTKT